MRPDYNSYYETDDAEEDRLFRWRALCAGYKANNIVELCDGISHGRVLDYGAGNGAVAAALSERGFSQDLNCVEISESGCAQIAARQDPNIQSAQTFDGYNVPFDDRSFDLVYSSHVLEHVDHERLFLSELQRLAPYVFIEVPLEDTLRLSGQFRANRTGHINFYNRSTLRRLVQTCGFEVLREGLYDTPLDVHLFSNKVRGIPAFALRTLSRLSTGKRVSSRLFTYHYAVLLRSPSVAATPSSST